MLEIPERPAALDLRNSAKLYAGGGEVVDHSSVHASQGSLPAISPLEVGPQQVADENQNAGRLKEHADGHDEIPDVPAAARLVGIDSARHPENPGICMKSKVRWNPMRKSQKCSLPSVSLYILPDIFGNQ